MDKIAKKMEQTPDITLKELIAEFNLQISQASLSKRLIKLGYTFKKRAFIQKNRKNPPL
jgi:transposase